MPARTFEVAPGITAIDTRMGGRAQVTASYLIDGSQPALIESGPSSCGPILVAALTRLGVGPSDLAHIVVSHIHLDHAGGAGHLLERFPNATVWVHEHGARHLADPTRLVASTNRAYGEARATELFGPVKAVPVPRLRPLSEGVAIDLGGRTIVAMDAPGHASHEVFLVDRATDALFTGDGLGVLLPDVGLMRPAVPPPEFDLELAVASVDRIRAVRPSMLVFSHFGPTTAVEETCALATERMVSWTAIVRAALAEGTAPEDVPAVLRAATSEETDGALALGLDVGRLEYLSSYELNAAGIVRYLTRPVERSG